MLEGLERTRKAGAGLPPDREVRRRRLYTLAAAAAILLGVAVRSYLVLRADFPLNDGGLFYEMTQNLRAAGYLLPAKTSYNFAGLPFAYPPLSFYIAGLLADLTHLSLIDVFRLLPLAASGLTVYAFYRLARVMVRSREVAIVASVAFALIPRSYIWLIMGGGVARALGLLFALLALEQAWHVFHGGRHRNGVLTSLYCGLTILSHLETGWFLAVSIAVFWLAFGRSREGMIRAAMVAGGTLLVASPWWLSVLAMHGLSPFVAAQSTGGSILSSGSVRSGVLWALLRLVATSEPFYPLLGTLGLLGLLIALVTRRWLLPAWWLAIFLFDARAFPTFISVPMAMLAGVAIVDGLVPLVAQLSSSAATGGYPSRLRSDLPTTPWACPAVVITLTVFVAYATAGAVTTKAGLAGEGGFLVPLSSAERAAMSWVSQDTPPDSRFLLITPNGWETDKESEWFPVLARRTSVATVQGYEWTSPDEFSQRVAAFEQAHLCGFRDASCLGAWSAEHDQPFTFVYIPRGASGQCCTTLVSSLVIDPKYSLVYNGPGATIFERR